MMLPGHEQRDRHIGEIVRHFRPNLESYEVIYKHLHQQPELSTQERQTAHVAAEHLKSLGFFGARKYWRIWCRRSP
jgi:metal-dependent amidase/aminoacylase/carboxypeptidase family protein